MLAAVTLIFDNAWCEVLTQESGKDCKRLFSQWLSQLGN